MRTETEEEHRALLKAVDDRIAAENRIGLHVDRLRELGVPWSNIAIALQMSKQAAWERFRRHDDAS